MGMITENLRVMEQYLIEFYTRSENSRNKILLTSKLEEIEVEYVETLYKENVFSESFTKSFEGIYRTANSVLNRLPVDKEFDAIRLGLLSIANRSLVDYSSIFMNASIEKIYSSANLLAELLMGIIPLDEIPSIPDEHSAEHEKMTLRHLSIIVSSAELYAIAIQIIPIIEREDLILWTNEVLTRFERMVEVFNSIDCEKILNRYQKLSKTEILVFNISSCIRLIAQVFRLIEHLYRAFESQWPEEIITTSHFPSKDLDGLYTYIQKSQKLLQKLNSIANRFDPMIKEKYGSNRGGNIFGDIQKVISLFQQTMIKYQILYAFEDRNLKLPDLDASIETLEQKVEEILQGAFLGQKSNLVDWTHAMFIYDDLIVFYVIRALISRDYLTFRSQIDTYLMHSFFNKAELFSETKFTAILADIFVAISITNKPNLLRYKELLEEEKSRLHPLSHMVIPYSTLIQIIRSKLNEDVEDICNELEKIFNTYFVEGNLYHLSEEFKSYINALKNCLHNRAPAWDIFNERLKRRLPEIRSWVIPDFTKIPEKRLRPSMRYVPFNFIRDRIQDSKHVTT